MAKKRQIWHNCFPDKRKSDVLPRVVLLNELDDVLREQIDSVKDAARQHFPETWVATRQSVLSRVGDLNTELRTKLEIPEGQEHQGELRTYGDLCAAAKSVARIIRASLAPHPKFKDRKLDPTMAEVVESCRDLVFQNYAREFGHYAVAPSQNGHGKAPAAPQPEEPVAPQTAEEQFVDYPDMTPTLNQGTELTRSEFPQPIHGYWDLDDLAQRTVEEAQEDALPRWVRSLTQSEANRLLQVCFEHEHRLDSSSVDGVLKYTDAYADDQAARSQLVSQLCRDPAGTKATVTQWLQRHTQHGHIQETGRFIPRPSVLRKQEQRTLMMPNVERIVEQHFARTETPMADRTFVDIGTWDGSMPYHLREQFGTMYGVEPTQRRFEQLCEQDTENLIPVNKSMEDLLEQQDEVNYNADVILFSHVLYFLQRGENDEPALKWAAENLKSNGMVIVILNDSDLLPGSRAHLRKEFGVREAAATPYFYQQVMEQFGLTTQMIQPSLYVKAHTEDGSTAMRELMRYALPGETRHYHEALDTYQKLIAGRGGIYNHTLNILVGYKDSASMPAAPVPRTVSLPFTNGYAMQQPTPRRAQSTSHSHDNGEVVAPLKPIADVSALEPADILTYLDEIAGRSCSDEQLARSLAESIGLEWYMYRLWCNERQVFEGAANILSHIREQQCAPDNVRIPAPEFELICQSLRRTCATEKAFRKLLRQVGLMSRYNSLEQRKRAALRRDEPAPEEPTVVPEPVPPVVSTVQPIAPRSSAVERVQQVQQALEDRRESSEPLSPAELLEWRAKLIETFTN